MGSSPVERTMVTISWGGNAPSPGYMVPGYGGGTTCVSPGCAASSANAATLAQNRIRCFTTRSPDPVTAVRTMVGKANDLINAGRKGGDEAHERLVALECNALRKELRGPRIVDCARGAEPFVGARRQRDEHLVRFHRPHRDEVGSGKSRC